MSEKSLFIINIWAFNLHLVFKTYGVCLQIINASLIYGKKYLLLLKLTFGLGFV